MLPCIRQHFSNIGFWFYFLFVFRFLLSTEAMLQKDIADNMMIGTNGAAAILANVTGDGPIRLLTHCNTGSLATAG